MNKSKKYTTLAVLAFSFLSLSGYSSPARTDFMSYKPDISNPIQYNLGFHENIDVGSVTGGKDKKVTLTSEITNEEFRKALITSLKNTELYSSSNRARFVLDVSILEVTHPALGINVKVKATIRYQLKDKESGNIILSRTITEEQTAGMMDSFSFGMTRLRLAKEGCVRTSIEEFLLSLSELAQNL